MEKNSEEALFRIKMKKMLFSAIFATFVIILIALAGCTNKEQGKTILKVPDFLSGLDKEGSPITWYAVDFEYKQATINMQTGATVITIQLPSGEERQINGGTFFSNLLFQNSSLDRILKKCNPEFYPCIGRAWAYEKKTAYTNSNMAYCPQNQQFCKNVVNYFMANSFDCGFTEGIEMRCLNEDWDKDLEQLGTIGRLIN